MADATQMAGFQAVNTSAATRKFRIQDRIFYLITLGSAILVVLLLLAILVVLVIDALPTFQTFGLSFLWGTKWSAPADIYGAVPAVVGTLVSSFIAMLIAVPLGIGIAIFLTELCPGSLRRPISTAIELLAGVPSIIYGIVGLFILVPLMQNNILPFLMATVGQVPVIGLLFQPPAPGVGLLTASLVLAVMILPFITAISRDVFSTVPPMLRESAYGMGMTTWEVARHILIPYTRRGLVGGIMLGLGRALGETMAVTFVIGSVSRLQSSIISPSTTISAQIANNFGDADGLQLSSLIALGLLLFVLSFCVLALARWMIGRGDSH
ncbi:phosphate ABC transporter permease subunit PstC [Rhizobium sp. CNPSo 4062]|uniref:phosphate ABC transporter permease subunit PstC n=1 Tax=Rhizobium sp. CNPSo 4062 TaxID=3021410 RepID=UPI0025519F6F|nr:phosphate ABC transporter permease subunit PstC [Rhizobium sp. CNPSo 4062]MDK4703748.1 phosphate ABC transporter permease subunit PstC [Rhizobium sp. CNPSo 4062]